MTTMNQLKVNLHITERCNFRCRYCFAHFENKQDMGISDWKRVIDNLRQSGMVSQINFAGGEPVLHRDFAEIVDYAYGQGFDLSVISNGSLLLEGKNLPQDFFRKITTLGISVDSIEPETLRALGCCDAHDNVLTQEKLAHLLSAAKTENPDLLIKLNTVVTNLNAGEKLTHLERELPIARWKFLKMKRFDDGQRTNKTLEIDEETFQNFLRSNARVQGESIPESSLTRSYIIIDNRGSLIDNAEDNYKTVGSLLREDFRTVFSCYAFDEELYADRYEKAG
jgi:radical SAM superfamily